MKQSKAAIFVLLAGALWGSMGLFVRKLNAAGLYAMDVVQARMLSALLFMGIFMMLFSRNSFRIRLKDLWCFLGSGIVSLLLFSLCYFSGMQVTSLNVMAVLLYTSPAIIMILSIILFHEKLTKRKLLALIMTFAGCCLVSGIGSESAVSMQGLLLGLGAGFYALYSIFSRFAIDRGYGAWTITFYTFLFCMLADAPLAEWGAMANAISADRTLLLDARYGLCDGVSRFRVLHEGLRGHGVEQSWHSCVHGARRRHALRRFRFPRAPDAPRHRRYSARFGRNRCFERQKSRQSVNFL